MLRMLLIAYLTVVLQACSFSAATPPEEHFYRLAVAKADQVAVQPVYETMVIKSVLADGIYNERAILYVNDDSPLEIRRYHYHYWLMTPARLIQEQFRSYLSASGISQQLLSQAAVNQELALSLRIANFERLVGSHNRVLVALDVSAQMAAADFEKSYRVELPAGATMHDTADAFGQALTRLFNDITKDLLELKNN